MDPLDERQIGPRPIVSPGRRDAVRSLAGAGAMALAVLELNRNPATARMNTGPAGLGADAAKKKKSKHGPAGPTGPAGPAARFRVFVDTFSVVAASFTDHTVACPSGVAVGGGVKVGGSGCFLLTSTLVGNDQWTARVGCPAGNSSPNNELTVICAS